MLLDAPNRRQDHLSVAVIKPYMKNKVLTWLVGMREAHPCLFIVYSCIP